MVRLRAPQVACPYTMPLTQRTGHGSRALTTSGVARREQSKQPLLFRVDSPKASRQARHKSSGRDVSYTLLGMTAGAGKAKRAQGRWNVQTRGSAPHPGRRAAGATEERARSGSATLTTSSVALHNAPDTMGTAWFACVHHEWRGPTGTEQAATAVPS